MQATSKAPAQPQKKRRRLVKAKDVASQQAPSQNRQGAGSGHKAHEQPIDLCGSDDAGDGGATAAEAHSSEDEGGPVKLGMHVDLSRGAALIRQLVHALAPLPPGTPGPCACDCSKQHCCRHPCYPSQQGSNGLMVPLQ